ncbi:unnamed protein product [Tilletia laevis]|uniref:VTT domain-containing protein n=1 Tax=Tilletia laevis TaxID=157183 RepID=A0A9N8MCG1_9BASI|nr:hypothetical protein CF335_g8324 [Tilletia laevis]CAD6888650.1 unnamed protein product [Tilletia caries]KAE8188758.1 hypothetical protein CF336_g6018 [Tilletia laevis]CAD6920392.1 unnamed protein product [Tilletia caries]CAD6922876.1 unnamed protein product [Tilletia laevis]
MVCSSSSNSSNSNGNGGSVWHLPPDRGTGTPDFTLQPAAPVERRHSLLLPLFTDQLLALPAPVSASASRPTSPVEGWWKQHHKRTASLPRRTAKIHTRRQSLHETLLDDDEDDEDEDDDVGQGLLPLSSSPSTSACSSPSTTPAPPACHHHTRTPSLHFASLFGLRSRAPAAPSSHRHTPTSTTSALTARFASPRRRACPSSPTEGTAPDSPCATRSRFPRAGVASLPQHLPALLVLAAIFILSTTAIVVALTTLPIHLPPSPNSTSFTNRLTHLTLADIKALTTSLKQYARTGTASQQQLQEQDVGELVAGPLGLGLAKLHVLLVLAALFTWKQAFTIPGSIIMNVIFGALYGTFWGTLYTSLLTAFGGMCCYLLCSPLSPLIASLPGLKRPLHAIRTALDPDAAAQAETQNGNSNGEDEMVEVGTGTRRSGVIPRSASRQRERGPLLSPSPSQHTTHESKASSSSSSSYLGNPQTYSYLLLLRLLPIIPYGITNIACSVLRTPLLPFVLTLALGSIPWNVLTCQVGELLDEVLSVALDVVATGGGEGAGAVQEGMGAISGVKAIVGQVFWKRETMARLGLVSLASVAPVLLGRLLQRKQRSSTTRVVVEEEPLLEMDNAAPAREGEVEVEVEVDAHGAWTSSVTAPLSPLIRPPPIAAPAPQHRPWWLDQEGSEDDLDLDLEEVGEYA